MSAVPRCALLFALPADRDDFDLAARGEAWADYGRLLFRGDPIERVWSERYLRVVTAVSGLIQAASKCEAHVIKRATRADVTAASADRDVLVIIGHWRGWVVTERDLRADVPTLIRVLRKYDQNAVFEGFTAADIARTLNMYIESGRLLAKDPRFADASTHPSVKLTLSRDVLDEMLGDLLVPGNMVELFDGLHTPLDFEAAINMEFRGVIDLATCNSAALATLISMRRHTSVMVVHTLELMDPVACCLALTDTFNQLAAGGDYTSARLETERRLVTIKRQLRREVIQR